MATLHLQFVPNFAERLLANNAASADVAVIHPHDVALPHDPATWTHLLHRHQHARLTLPATLSAQDLRCARAFAFAAFTGGIAQFDVLLAAPLAGCDARVLEAVAFIQVLEMPKTWHAPASNSAPNFAPSLTTAFTSTPRQTRLSPPSTSLQFSRPSQIPA